MRLKLLMIIFLFFGIYGCKNIEESKVESQKYQEPPKTIMAIFAHPDDETTMGSVLAKYANVSDVHVVVATDGRYGVTDHYGMATGDSLVAVRTKEMACACEALGVNPPHFLEAKDGLGLNGNHNFYNEVPKLKERIKNKIVELKPDVILTFGPDGDTGHPDHRMVGMLTTEILLRENWASAIDLYYFAWTKEQTTKFPEDWSLGWVHSDMLDTKITFSPKDEEKALTSLRCHQSQFTEEEFQTWIQAEKDDTANTLYFRKFAIDTTKRNGF